MKSEKLKCTETVTEYFMKHVIFLIIYLISNNAVASRCQNALSKLEEVEVTRIVGFLTALTEKNIFTQDAALRFLESSPPHLSDIRFQDNITESQKVSVRAALDKILSDTIVQSQWRLIKKSFSSKFKAISKNEKKVEIVSGATKNLPAVERIYENKWSWPIAQIKEHNAMVFASLRERGNLGGSDVQTVIYDFESKSENAKIIWEKHIPDFKRNMYLKFSIDSEDAYYYFDKEDKKHVLRYQEKERVLSYSGSERGFAIYKSLSGTYAILSDADLRKTYILPVNTSEELFNNKVIKITAIDGERTARVIAGTRENLYYIRYNIINSKLEVIDVTTAKLVKGILVDFELDSNIGQQSSFETEVIINGEPHALLTTDKGLKLLNLYSWNITNLNKNDRAMNTLYIKQYDDRIYSIQRENNERGMILSVFDFSKQITAVREFKMSSDHWNIGNEPFIKIKDRMYYVYLTDNHELTILDIDSDHNIVAKKLPQPTNNAGIGIFAATNTLGEHFISLVSYGAAPILEIYRVKNL